MHPGLEPLPTAGSIQQRTARITADVLRRCDLALLLLDARAGKPEPICPSSLRTRLTEAACPLDSTSKHKAPALRTTERLACPGTAAGRLLPAGVVPADEALVAWLRASIQKPTLLVANKAERRGNTASSGTTSCDSPGFWAMLIQAVGPSS